MKYGRPCAFCGMTTSFLDISEGRFGDAGQSNHGVIPLYLLFLSNELGALVFFSRKGAFLSVVAFSKNVPEQLVVIPLRLKSY